MDEDANNRCLYFPLTQITLESKSKTAFEFIKNEAFTKGLLEKCSTEDIIVKQGSSFPVSQNLTVFRSFELFEDDLFSDIIVLQCEPLKQGLLRATTNIVAVDRVGDCENGEQLQNELSKLSTVHTNSIDSESNGVKPQDELPCSVPYMSDFLDVYRLPKFQSNMAPGQLLEAIVLQKKDDCYIRTNLKAVFKFERFHQLIVECCGDIKRTFSSDINNTAVITRDFAQKCGLFDGDYVEVKPINSSLGSSPQKSVGFHICQVKVVETVDSLSCEDRSEVFYVLPSVFYSLQAGWEQVMNIHMEVYVKRFLPMHVDTSRSSVSSGHTPPFASELHISCVKSPSYNALDSYADLLQAYFSVPRLVKKNVVLCLNSKDDPEFWQNVTESSEQRLPVVYFKVTKISPKVKGCKVFLADAVHTTLYLDTPVSSFVPSLMSHVMKGDHVTPPGLKSHVTELLQILTPFVQAKCPENVVYPSVLLSGPSGCGKTWICHTVAAYLGLHCFQVNCHELSGETSGATEARIKHNLQRAASYCPSVCLLRNLDALGKDRDGTGEDPRVASTFQDEIASLATSDNNNHPTLLIATTSAYKTLTSDMQECFLHHIDLGTPSETQRLEMISRLFEEVDLRKDVSLKHIAQRTAGLVLGDIKALVTEVKRAAYNRITQYCKSCTNRPHLSWQEEKSVGEVGYSIGQEDFDEALDRLQAAHSDSLGAPKIPNVQWADVGGLVSVKSEILDTVQLPLQHPELFAQGLRRSGVLLYGPPGTGKTLLAKAVATECSLNFLSVKGPELINMYVGQSEENIREVFQRARSASPCVIFFDELDSLAPNRGRSGDSGGVMDRVVSQLLAELDGLHKSADVFVIGATNRPDLLDPALLRPGRFDKLLYLGVSEDRQSQLNIIQALTRRFHLSSDCNLDSVVSQCPYNMTGADFYALCSDAMLNALKRSIDLLEKGEEIDQSRITVEEEDFHKALDNLVPSVSIEELYHYKTLQESFNVAKKVARIEADFD